MKVLRFVVALLPLLFGAVPARAQAGFDAFFALGTAHDGSTNQSLDILGTGNPQMTPAMGGVFGTLGGGVMLTPHFGVGAEVSFRFTQGDYAGAQYRPVFYDFNAIYVPPLRSKRFVPELQGGLGGTSIRFYGGQEYCDPYTGFCSDYAGSSNHLQLHAAVGVRYYFNPNLFIRPQFDLHWVRNFNEFSSDLVPEYGIAIGFSSSR